MPDYIEREPILENAVCRNSRAVGFVPVRFILDAPAKDVVEVRRARWVEVQGKWNGKLYVGVCCSSCRQRPKDRVTKSAYCPNCGAIMENGRAFYERAVDYSALFMECSDEEERNRILEARQHKIDCEGLEGKVPSNEYLIREMRKREERGDRT